MIYPKYYYCKRGDSDRDRILHNMKFIPEHKQQEVSDEYDRIYRASKQNSARTLANNYLKGIAMEYHHENIKKRQGQLSK